MTLALSALTGQQIIDEAEAIIGETIDVDLALSLINHFKNLIELEEDWVMLITEDSSNTYSSGQTYLTAKTLPEDFLRDYKVFLGDASMNSFQEYFSIPYHLRRKYNDITNRYYIDWKNLKIHICGKVDTTYTIYLYYFYQTPDITLLTSPVWPAKFHRLLVMLLAEYYQSGLDYDDISARQAISHNKQAQILYSAMLQWNSALQLRTINNMTPMSDDVSSLRTDRVDTDN